MRSRRQQNRSDRRSSSRTDTRTIHNQAVGHILNRPDARAKVTGEAIYTDDLSFEGMLYAKVKRAGVPHAILKKLDLSKAKD
jgi:xanthine dehydrogenase molybdenum-binding subunit